MFVLSLNTPVCYLRSEQDIADRPVEPLNNDGLEFDKQVAWRD